MIELAPQTIDKIQSMFQKEEKKEEIILLKTQMKSLKRLLMSRRFFCNHYVIKHMKL